jgi:hypothetical protein
MTTVRETEIDGVLCFFVDQGRPVSSAHLLFRHGLADEALPETGWVRLLEHLALLDRETLNRPIHGTVSMLLTRFDVFGGPEAVVERVAALSRWLFEPDLRLLARERGVLQADAQLRADPLVRSLPWRYGAKGPGVAGFMEVGAVRATPELLTERAQRVFNNANALLVLDGPPPANLRIPLVLGEYQPPRAAEPVPRALPASYVDDSGLTLSGVVRRSHAASFLPGILERAVHDGLRQRTGGAYAPWSSMVEVDDQLAVVAGGSDVVPETRTTAGPAGLAVLDQLVEEGVPRAWVHEAVEQRLARLQTPEAAFQVAREAAYAALSARVPQSLEELVEELRATDPGQVDLAVRELRSSLLVGLPEGATPDVSTPPITFAEVEPTSSGRRHRHVNWPADASTFSVDDGAVEVGTVVTARRLAVSDVVAMFAWRDGTRELVGRDGSRLEMDPHQWYGAAELTRDLDDAVPAELHVPMADRETTFRRMGIPQRASEAFVRWATTKAGLVTLMACCGLLAVWSLLKSHVVVAGVFLALGLVIGAQRYRLEHSWTLARDADVEGPEAALGS